MQFPTNLCVILLKFKIQPQRLFKTTIIPQTTATIMRATTVNPQASPMTIKAKMQQMISIIIKKKKWMNSSSSTSKNLQKSKPNSSSSKKSSTSKISTHHHKRKADEKEDLGGVGK